MERPLPASVVASSGDGNPLVTRPEQKKQSAGTVTKSMLKTIATHQVRLALPTGAHSLAFRKE
jgi:hypothetical protein